MLRHRAPGTVAGFDVCHTVALPVTSPSELHLASIYTNPGDVSGVRWGSGTMISPDLFLTCGHLFDQTGGGWERPRQNGTTTIIRVVGSQPAGYFRAGHRRRDVSQGVGWRCLASVAARLGAAWRRVHVAVRSRARRIPPVTNYPAGLTS